MNTLKELDVQPGDIVSYPGSAVHMRPEKHYRVGVNKTLRLWQDGMEKGTVFHYWAYWDEAKMFTLVSTALRLKPLSSENDLSQYL